MLIELATRDRTTTTRFYERALGFWTEGERLRFGAQSIELVDASRGGHAMLAANDLAFQHFAICVHDIEAAYDRLSEATGWTPTSRGGPVKLPVRSGGVTAFKFRDPEGHPLELIEFPEQRAEGIDHTAIVVSDTPASIAFYDRLGFEAKATTLNHGPTQDALDGLDGTRVEVTALQPGQAERPHLELLCYRQPRSTRTPITFDDVLATRIVLSSQGREIVDPDGHRLLV